MAVRIVTANEGMAEAVERLRNGKLVAFPTETVYGLGADARNADAIAQIFRTKGRPATNPLIVHVSDKMAAQNLTSHWTPGAEELATQYWPGPLTLVLAKTNAIPAIVTAGGNTVGLRVPGHPIALELLQKSGVPVAAPSANRSEEVSPTTAQHVADSLGPYTNDLLILDGGACTVGIESTVVDVTGDSVRLLRPGMVSLSSWQSATNKQEGEEIARSPGQRMRHYAPSVPVHIVSDFSGVTSQDGVIVSRFAETQEIPVLPHLCLLPGNPVGYAAGLYAALRSLDAAGVRQIVIVAPPDTVEWAAIQDRLRRAATPKGV